MFKPFLDEILEAPKNIGNPQLRGMRLPEIQAHGQRVEYLVSPYHTPTLDGPAVANIRATYGLIKEMWNHVDWNHLY